MFLLALPNTVDSTVEENFDLRWSSLMGLQDDLFSCPVRQVVCRCVSLSVIVEKNQRSNRSSPTFPPPPPHCGRGESPSCSSGHSIEPPSIGTLFWKPALGVHFSSFCTIACFLSCASSSRFPPHCETSGWNHGLFLCKMHVDQIAYNFEEIIPFSRSISGDVLSPTFLTRPSHTMLSQAV